MGGLKTLLPRLLVTLVIVVLAAFAVRALWVRYEVEPWTRDGRIRAKTVQLAPDVSGLVTEVPVQDNSTVRAGEVVFVIDQARFDLAKREAEARLAALRTTAAQARREANRNTELSDLIARETVEQGATRVEQQDAEIRQAEAALDTAKLNLQRSVVRSPTDGYVSDVFLQVGDYANVGRPVLALVERDSIHVEGYFEETKLRHVRVGQKAIIRVMGEPRPVLGHVVSIAPAIYDRDRAQGSNLLPNVNPTFSWVRLAQRVPVWIDIDKIPEGLAIVPGRTVSVELVQDQKRTGPRLLPARTR